jgi:hypothetical protein
VSHGVDIYPRGSLELSAAVRLGRRGAIEAKLPADIVRLVGATHAGVGDVEFEGKYILATRETPSSVSIATAGLAVAIPSGSRSWGFGEGTTTFEPFFSAGLMRGSIVVQGDIRAIVPTPRLPEESQHYVEYHVSVLSPRSPGARPWTVGVEVGGIDASLAITPEIVRGITRTGSLVAGFGVELPVRPVAPLVRGVTRWSGYLAWDYREPFRARR